MEYKTQFTLLHSDVLKEILNIDLCLTEHILNVFDCTHVLIFHQR